MHHIYHTDAFVLGSRPHGEDSKVISLYTRELGLVHARAQGIRKLSSKLRFVMQDFSRVNVDLVRGREVWRLTSATPDVTGRSDFSKNPKASHVLARVISVVSRLVAGEDPSEAVFETLEIIYALLAAPRASSDDYAAIELLAVGRILVTLGYQSEAIFGFESNETLIEKLKEREFKQSIVRSINDALAASQL